MSDAWAFDLTAYGTDLVFVGGGPFDTLRKYNGTTTEALPVASGYVIGRDHNPSSRPSFSELTVLGSQLFFRTKGSTSDGSESYRLWKYDGTEITPVTEIMRGSNLTAIGTQLYFGGAGYNGVDRELWIHDGIAATQLADINVTTDNSFVGPVVEMNGHVYFVANDIDSGFLNNQVWKSNGTAAGTVPITDFVAHYGSDRLPKYDDQMAVMNNRLYFVGDDGTGGSLWWTDGGAPQKIDTTYPFAHLRGLTILTDPVTSEEMLVFFGRSTSLGSDGMWKTDGMTISPIPIVGPHNISFAGKVAVIDNEMFFGGSGLWRCDGIQVDPVPVEEGYNLRGVSSVTAIGEDVYFGGAWETPSGDGYQTELWKTSLTGPSRIAHLVKDINDDGSGWFNTVPSDPGGFTLIGNEVYFTAYDFFNIPTLFKTRGNG